MAEYVRISPRSLVTVNHGGQDCLILLHEKRRVNLLNVSPAWMLKKFPQPAEIKLIFCGKGVAIVNDRKVPRNAWRKCVCPQCSEKFKGFSWEQLKAAFEEEE